MEESNLRLASRVSWNTIVGNVILSALKLFAGIYSNSSAMVSDAMHSLSDVFSTFIVLIGLRLAGKKSDKDHQYGHERMECVAAILLAALLFATGISIGWSGAAKIFSGNYSELSVPGLFALIMALVSIAVKEGMYWYTRAAAKKIGSGALMADAWHHRSDALSSIGSFAGILGARLGFPVLDSVACVIICLFILKVAFDIFMDAIGKMTDKACGEEVSEEIRSIILSHEGVLRIDQLKTRMFGDKIYVDVEISADGGSTLTEAHDIAQCVHDAIEARMPEVKHCMVHMNPLNPYESDGE